jgi:3-oxoacyl-[acyl-carrier-protein] synthase III
LDALKFTNSLSNDFSCGEIGNLGAGSIGAWLSRICQLGSKGKLNMLAVGFGSGLSWGLASLVVDVGMNEVIYV